MHTPRLCIDGRLDKRSYQGIVAEEIINQLVACRGEPAASNEWVEKGQTVLLAHPGQVFGGQWRRYNTKMPIGISPLYWAWERNFVKEASLTVFHKFRQSDRLGLELPCETVTTVLSPGSIPKAFQFTSTKQLFIVSSRKDRAFLSTNHRIPVENIKVIKPTIRRFNFFSNPPDLKSEGQILMLQDTDGTYHDRLLKIIRGRFSSLPVKTIRTREARAFEPLQWMKLLEQTLFAFYLVTKPYDWATAALELLYWGIPVLFSDENGPLNELLPTSPLRLSSFLVDQPDLPTLRATARDASHQLEDGGVFTPLSFARQFSAVYSELPHNK